MFDGHAILALYAQFLHGRVGHGVEHVRQKLFELAVVFVDAQLYQSGIKAQRRRVGIVVVAAGQHNPLGLRNVKNLRQVSRVIAGRRKDDGQAPGVARRGLGCGYPGLLQFQVEVVFLAAQLMRNIQQQGACQQQRQPARHRPADAAQRYQARSPTKWRERLVHESGAAHHGDGALLMPGFRAGAEISAAVSGVRVPAGAPGAGSFARKTPSFRWFQPAATRKRKAAGLLRSSN